MIQYILGAIGAFAFLSTNRDCMFMRWTRRKFIATAAVLINGCDSDSSIFTTTSERYPAGLSDQLAINKDWKQTCNQAWIGQEFWSNRLADWHVHQGRLSTRGESSSLRNRTVSLLSVAVAEVSGNYRYELHLTRFQMMTKPLVVF